MKLLPKRDGGPGKGESLVVSTATDVGRVRSNNEDSVRAVTLVHDRRAYAVWAVADGVGGGPDGERASCTAVETVLEQLAVEPWQEPADGLTVAISLANERVFAITGTGRAATTLVVAVVSERDGVATIANVGDSRAYLRRDGLTTQITRDHSLVAERVAAGQLTREEARKSPERNLILRAVGSQVDVEPEFFGPLSLRSGDRLVLCSDGVHGLIEDDEIARIVAAAPIPGCAAALVSAAVEAGGTDNATALVGGYGAELRDAARTRRLLPSVHRPHIGRRRVDAQVTEDAETEK